MTDTPTNNGQNTSDPMDKKVIGDMTGNQLLSGAVWWAMLVIAVIAIPAFAVAITLALPFGQTAQVFAFVITCWVCTYIGMWLMKRAK